MDYQVDFFLVFVPIIIQRRPFARVVIAFDDFADNAGFKKCSCHCSSDGFGFGKLFWMERTV